MILSTGFDAGLAALIVALALWATTARETFAAVVGFVALGLLLALAWMRLAAPDVAMTEAAIGSGITGGLLVAAAGRGRPAVDLPQSETAAPPRRLAAGTVAVLFAAGIAGVMLSLPYPAPTLAPAAAAHLAATGLENPVNAALLAYRAIDTLLETIVLLIALLAVWSLTPDPLWGGQPGLRQSEDPNSVLVFFARLLPPVGVLVGIHLFWVGSVAPGGEFQSATVLAAMWIITWMAGLVDTPPIGERRLRLWLAAGPAVFLTIGIAGFFMAGAFLAYPPDHAKLLILVIELAVTLSIAATLSLLVAGPPQRAPRA